MKYLAKWGPKGFLISPSKIVPFNDFATTVALKADSENDTSGTAPTNTRGLELQQMNFSTTYLRAAGVDPRAQWEEWQSLVGKVHPLLIEGRQFGPKKMLLKEVSLSAVEFNNTGAFLSATVSIVLQEYAEKKAGTSSSGTSSSGATSTASGATTNAATSQAAAVYAATVAAKKEALNTTASKTDKASKKPGAFQEVMAL